MRGKTYVRPYQTNAGKSLRRSDFDAATLAIWREYDKRRTSTVFQSEFPSKNENHKNFLRREIYVLGLELLRSPPTSWSISDLAKKIRVSRNTRPESMGNVFHDLFMCIYEDDQGIARQERSKMAMELQYAHRHNIPPELLCGFIYQSGDRKDLSKKLSEGYIEPAFR